MTKIDSYTTKLKQDLETIMGKAKPMKGVGFLKDQIKPFDKINIDKNDVVILNHRDMDGYMSGIITSQFFGGCEMIDVQYNEEIDIKKLTHKVVFIVDFSLSKEDLTSLSGVAKRVIWIDHHIGPMTKLTKELSKEVSSKVEGILCDGPSGCELTWLYLYGSAENIPPAVLIAGAYDTFRYNNKSESAIIKADAKFHDEFIMPMHYAYRKEFGDQTDSALQALVATGKDAGDKLSSMFVEGTAIWKYVKQEANLNVRNHGFLVELEGIKFASMFNNCRGSSEFGDAIANTEAEAMLAILPNDKGAFLSFYCDDDLEMNKVAQKFGGNGHRGAAGAFVDKQQLSELYSKAKPLTFSK